MATYTVTVTDAQLRALEHDLPSSEIEADIQRRLDWVVTHKSEQCRARMIAAGMPFLKADDSVTSIPVDEDELAALIKAHANYLDRDGRDVLENNGG